VATHTSVADLARCDETTLLTLADEVRRQNEANRWTTTHELIANVWDLLHLLRVEALAGMGVRKHALPKHQHVPRPGERDEIPTIRPRDLARLTAGG
jgi:hypothetical protein